jgi:hypothetical protein
MQAIIDHPDTVGIIYKEPKPARKADRQAAPIAADLVVSQAVSVGVEKGVDDAEVTPDNLSLTPDNLAITPDNLSDTPDNLSTKSDADTTYRARAVLNHEFNHVRKKEIKPCSSSDGLSEERSHGWPFPIELHHLQNRDAIQRLFEHAVRFTFITRDLRVRFFAEAKFTTRTYFERLKTKDPILDPGAFFSASVRDRRWHAEACDTKAALNAITLLDGNR